MNPFIFLLIVTFLLGFVISANAQNNSDKKLQPSIDALREKGEEPLDFVMNQLKEHDLIIFDDALHPAVEPFEFYQKLIKSPDFHGGVKNIFIEAIPINQQVHVEKYLATTPEDQTLLYPVFQNDFSGFGFNFQTYFDLLHTIYQVNQTLPEDEQLTVFGVSSPTYWSEIHTYRDLELFRQSLKVFDYAMYQNILSGMDYFKRDQKGIFLTNTRHAYKGIKDKGGNYHWNCGTFFHQWHPEKTYSIRFHNINLYMEKIKIVDENTVKTTQGLEQVDYRWVRMAKGLWDSAFEAFGNKPVAVPLEDTPFGEEPYIGNHMLNCAAGQTMFDAYDAIIFLAPLKSLRWTAMTDKIYTDGFKKELIRRHRIIYNEEQLKKEMEDYGVQSIQELVDKKCVYEPENPLPLLEGIGSIDEWKRE